MKTRFKLALIATMVLIACASAFANGNNEGEAGDEMTHLSIQIWDRDIPGLDMANGYQATFAKEAMAAQGIDLEIVTVPRWENLDVLNILMASGDAPDLCLAYDGSAISNWIQQGGLVDLGPYLEEYGQNIIEYLGEDCLEYGIWDGVRYAIPALRPATASFGTFIREDWLDALGMDAPTTTEEFHQYLLAVQANDPGNRGDNLIPFAIGMDENNIDFNVSTLVWSFVEEMNDEEFASLWDLGRWVMPGYKEGIRYLNQLYNEGLIFRDFALDTDGSQYEREIVQGNVGAFIWNFDMPYRQAPGYLFELRKTVPEANWLPIDPFVNSRGETAKPRYAPNGLFAFVPIFNEDRAAEVVQYLDWMVSDPSIIWRLQNGEEGIHYLSTSPDGVPMDRVANEDLPNEYKWHWHDFSVMTTGSYDYGSDELNVAAAAMSYPGHEREIELALESSYRDAFAPPHFTTIIESEARYAPTLKALGAEIYVRSITCEPEDFDQIYDTLVADYLEAGGQAVIDEKAAAFRAAH